MLSLSKDLSPLTLLGFEIVGKVGWLSGVMRCSINQDPTLAGVVWSFGL